ncbi:uncharacterized protein Z518_04997 [Rhinocladiella mackenziei CBS 650.93]|uniref:Uncharacterized protein n=1 Tax=Rhinocladiella mackenziei CBS 650.93 TaxID=1442369 RepID=A0A0D2IV51_9EURO|nr:uncharacterized protein Z518_04997 [Rhinocladiella mackenziei CBS 650.93]KIX07021.1 hypothetical protein Z518_04997 [Rhinocladiella mackenziei CBS 650.93]
MGSRQVSVDLGVENELAIFVHNSGTTLTRISRFWSIKLDGSNDVDDQDEEEEGNAGNDSKGVFSFKDPQPLLDFHKLRYLRLNGMMRSYQPLIWASKESH